MLTHRLTAEQLKSRERTEVKAPAANPAASATDDSKPLTRPQIQRMREIAAEEMRTGTWVTYKPES